MDIDPLTSWHTHHHDLEPSSLRAGSFGEHQVEDIIRHVADARRSRPTIPLSPRSTPVAAHRVAAGTHGSLCPTTPRSA